MSKRFGRNQKRRMREQLEAVQKERDTYKAWYRQAQVIMRRNKRIVEDTADVLGSHFFTLDPECIEVRQLDAVLPSWRAPIMPRSPRIQDVDTGPDSATFMEHLLPILYGRVSQGLQGQQHFRFSVAGHTVGYAIDLDAFRQAPDRIGTRYLTIEIAEQLAYHMMRSINNRPELDQSRYLGR